MLIVKSKMVIYLEVIPTVQFFYFSVQHLRVLIVTGYTIGFEALFINEDYVWLL